MSAQIILLLLFINYSHTISIVIISIWNNFISIDDQINVSNTKLSMDNFINNLYIYALVITISEDEIYLNILSNGVPISCNIICYFNILENLLLHLQLSYDIMLWLLRCACKIFVSSTHQWKLIKFQMYMPRMI